MAMVVVMSRGSMSVMNAGGGGAGGGGGGGNWKRNAKVHRGVVEPASGEMMTLAVVAAVNGGSGG